MTEYYKCWNCGKYEKEVFYVLDSHINQEASFFQIIWYQFRSKTLFLCIDCIKKHNKFINKYNPKKDKLIRRGLN